MDSGTKMIERQEAEALKRGKEMVMRKIKEQQKKAKKQAIRKIIMHALPYIAIGVGIIIGILLLYAIIATIADGWPNFTWT